MTFRTLSSDIHSGGEDPEIPDYLARALADLRRFEGRLLNGSPLPPAYLVVTNRPFDHNLDGADTRCSALFEGFQIPDFKSGAAFPSLRAAHRARLAHADLHQLMSSMRKHSEIPVTFDGQAPELARAGSGFSDRSISGMTAIFSHNSRSNSDETTETQPLAGLQGEGGFGGLERREDDRAACGAL